MTKETVREACLRVAPPSSQPEIKFDGPEEGCQEPYDTCFAASEALKLGFYIRRMQRYATMVYDHCGPTGGRDGQEDGTD